MSRGGEGRQPVGVKIDGVRQHERRERVDASGGEQLGDLGVRLVGDPLVDRHAGVVGRAQEVDAVDAGAVILREQIEKARQERQALLSPDGVHERQAERRAVGHRRLEREVERIERWV